MNQKVFEFNSKPTHKTTQWYPRSDTIFLSQVTFFMLRNSQSMNPPNTKKKNIRKTLVSIAKANPGWSKSIAIQQHNMHHESRIMWFTKRNGNKRSWKKKTQQPHTPHIQSFDCRFSYSSISKRTEVFLVPKIHGSAVWCVVLCKRKLWFDLWIPRDEFTTIHIVCITKNNK